MSEKPLIRALRVIIALILPSSYAFPTQEIFRYDVLCNGGQEWVRARLVNIALISACAFSILSLHIRGKCET